MEKPKADPLATLKKKLKMEKPFFRGKPKVDPLASLRKELKMEKPI